MLYDDRSDDEATREDVLKHIGLDVLAAIHIRVLWIQTLKMKRTISTPSCTVCSVR